MRRRFSPSILPATFFLLITIPSLVRVLKRERFRTVAFGQGLTAYLMALVEYGFVLSATRKISAVRENHKLASRTVSDVMASRMILYVGSFLLLSAVEPLVRAGHTGLKPGASSSGTARTPARRVGASGTCPDRMPFGPTCVERGFVR